MKAVLLQSKRRGETWEAPSIALVDLPRPSPEEGEVLLRVVYCGICGSDFSMAASDAEGRMRYPGLARFPLVPGHEFSAVVEEAAAHDRWKAGDPVVVEETWGCGRCFRCRAGHPGRCEEVEKIGFTRNGAFSEWVVAPSAQLHSAEALVRRFGAADGMKMGALVQPYAVAFAALFGAEAAPWVPGSSVLVVGAGAIGFAAADLALAGGAGRVCVVERNADRRRRLCDAVADPRLEVLPAIPREGEFEWILDAAGAAELTDPLISLAKTGAAFVALARTGVRFGAEHLARKAIRVLAPDGHRFPDAYPKVIALMAGGQLHALRLVERVAGLQECQQILSEQPEGWGKVLVSAKDEREELKWRSSN